MSKVDVSPMTDAERETVAEMLEDMPDPEARGVEGPSLSDIERRARRALAGEPGVSWDEAKARLVRRFGPF